MTVLIAQNLKDEIIFAADSCAFTGQTKRHAAKHSNWKKIKQVNGIVFSTCGYMRDCINFQLFCSIRKPESNTVLAIQRFFMEFKNWLSENKIGVNKELVSNFFISYRNKVFHYVDGAVCEIEEGEFQVDGAGLSEAYMAMYLGKSPQEAVELTVRMNVWTGGEAQVVRLKK